MLGFQIKAKNNRKENSDCDCLQAAGSITTVTDLQRSSKGIPTPGFTKISEPLDIYEDG